jgi:hypothetical protein
MTTYTVGACIQDTLTALMGSQRDELNTLSSTISPTQATIGFTYPLNGIVSRTYLEIEEETIYVFSVDPTGQTAVVLRGAQGTTKATHTSGVLVYVNPAFPQADIKRALQQEIRSWQPKLYQVLTTEIPLTAAVRGYDLGALQGLITVLDVRRRSVAYATGNISASSFPPNPYGLNAEAWPRVKYEYIPSAPTVDFPSGRGLVIRELMDASIPSLHVTYAAPFNTEIAWTDTTDLIADVGVDPSDTDLPIFGACWRLLLPKEVRRTLSYAQGQPMDEQQIPPLYTMKVASEFKAARDDRMNAAQGRLLANFPIRLA